MLKTQQLSFHCRGQSLFFLLSVPLPISLIKRHSVCKDRLRERRSPSHLYTSAVFPSLAIICLGEIKGESKALEVSADAKRGQLTLPLLPSRLSHPLPPLLSLTFVLPQIFPSEESSLLSLSFVFPSSPPLARPTFPLPLGSSFPLPPFRYLPFLSPFPQPRQLSGDAAQPSPHPLSPHQQ